MTLSVVLFLLSIILNISRNISDRVSPLIPPSYLLSLYTSRKHSDDPSKINLRLSAKLFNPFLPLFHFKSSNRLHSATVWSSHTWPVSSCTSPSTSSQDKKWLFRLSSFIWNRIKYRFNNHIKQSRSEANQLIVSSQIAQRECL